MPEWSEHQEWHFPKAGIDRAGAFGRQPARQLPGTGEHARTTTDALNVRALDPGGTRSRGGSRPGLSRYVRTRINGSTRWVVQDLNSIVGTAFTAPGGGAMSQDSLSGRVVLLVAVSNGVVKTASPGDTAWTAVTNNTGSTPALNNTGILFSTACLQKLFFADGANWVYYTPLTNALETWAATAGTLPVDSDSNKPRLICTYRGRVVLSGLLKDPQNWFMSAVDDPFDFDYAPAFSTGQQAVAGNNSRAGLVGDVVTALIPYSDDVLIFGGDHTIYQLSGDPMDGGKLDVITEAVGIAWGQAWTMDPYGAVYFFSNHCGVYRYTPGRRLQPDDRISRPIDTLLKDINTGENIIRMLWDDRLQGLHLFVTPLDAPAVTTHYFWEQRAGAWWKDRFADKLYDPLCCTMIDGNDPDDRAALIGCWDGYVRALSMNADDDDGLPIDSYVVIGPITTPLLDDMLLSEIQGVLGTTSGDVTFEVFAGDTAEEALDNDPLMSGSWAAGRNFTTHAGVSGYAVYVKLSSEEPWAMEAIRAVVSTTGTTRRRRA
jgi:hypothetical protein